MSKVLIADDEIAMREMLALACRLDGHDVSQAVDAPSAIASASREVSISKRTSPAGATARTRPTSMMMPVNMERR